MGLLVRRIPTYQQFNFLIDVKSDWRLLAMTISSVSLAMMRCVWIQELDRIQETGMIGIQSVGNTNGLKYII